MYVHICTFLSRSILYYIYIYINYIYINYIYIYIHTPMSVPTYIHTYMQAHVHADARLYTCMCIFYTYIHTYIHTLHTDRQTDGRTDGRTDRQTYTSSDTYAGRRIACTSRQPCALRDVKACEQDAIRTEPFQVLSESQATDPRCSCRCQSLPAHLHPVGCLPRRPTAAPARIP